MQSLRSAIAAAAATNVVTIFQRVWQRRTFSPSPQKTVIFSNSFCLFS
jgi:hypothetical protein